MPNFEILPVKILKFFATINYKFSISDFVFGDTKPTKVNVL